MTNKRIMTIYLGLTEVKFYIKDNCWIPVGARNNMGRVTAFDYERGHADFVHRIACRKFHGEAPKDKQDVLHSKCCRDKACFNPNHIRWGDHSENMAERDPFDNDRKLHRDWIVGIYLAAHAENNNPKVVDMIREEYGIEVTHQMVSNIRNGANWTSVTGHQRI